MRIVLDTNVVFSGVLWRGPAHALLQLIEQRPSIQLLSSAALVEELADVLTRPSATRQLAIINRTVHEVLLDYIQAVELVEPLTVPRVVRDVDDDQVIAAAVAAEADLIVSGDKDLLVLQRHQGIAIVAPAQALLQLGQ